jgi:hypothetical protein
MNPTKPNQIKSAKDLSDGLVLKEDIKNKVPIDKTSITNRKKASRL